MERRVTWERHLALKRKETFGMKLRVPSYYKEFTCLAGACRHSCCVGWEVDVDEDTAAYYETVEGVLGERLRRLAIFDNK